MSYIAFDLDETLASVYSLEPFLHVLFALQDQNDKDRYTKYVMSPDLRKKLDSVYNAFISLVATEIVSRKVHILRPGILEFFDEILSYKKKGLVRACAIYSNNALFSYVRCVADIIEEILYEPNLFCATINYYHPLRFTSAGIHQAAKTLPNLQRIFAESLGYGSPADIPSSRILFIDDLSHPLIRQHLSPFQSYFVAEPFEVSPQYKVLEKCFLTAIQSVSLLKDPEFIEYSRKILHLDTANENIFLFDLRKCYRHSSFNVHPNDKEKMSIWLKKQINRIQELENHRIGDDRKPNGIGNVVRKRIRIINREINGCSLGS